MADQHPITPPPELVERWRNTPEHANELSKVMLVSMTTSKLQEIANRAARWGADKELEACCEWLSEHSYVNGAISLQKARRPEPPSLKKQASESLGKVVECFKMLVPGASVDGVHIETIRRALETLDD